MIVISFVHIRKHWRRWLIRLILFIVALYALAVGMQWVMSVHSTSPMNSPHGPVMLTKHVCYENEISIATTL